MIFCEVCGGEETVPAFYVDDAKRLVRYVLQRCTCAGGPSTRSGEGHVSEKGKLAKMST